MDCFLAPRLWNVHLLLRLQKSGAYIFELSNININLNLKQRSSERILKSYLSGVNDCTEMSECSPFSYSNST